MEQGRFSRPAGADDRHQAALADREAHLVEPHLFPVPDGQVSRDQRDITLVEELLQLAANQAERGRADADEVPLGHHGPQHRVAVQERPVPAAQVDDFEAVAGVPQVRMMAGDAEIVYHDVIVVRPADVKNPRRAREHNRRPQVLPRGAKGAIGPSARP
jgi:hypothetical protein